MLMKDDKAEIDNVNALADNCDTESTTPNPLTRVPQFLIVHLERFSAGAHDGGEARKVNTLLTSLCTKSTWTNMRTVSARPN